MDKKNNLKKIMYYTDFIRQYKPLADKAGGTLPIEPGDYPRPGGY